MAGRAGVRTALIACIAWGVVFGAAMLLPRQWPISTQLPEPSEIDPAGIPRLELSIQVRDFLLIKQLRDRAVEEEFLFRSENDMVSGVIYTQGRPVRVKVRLKGDYADHFSSKKWSWRVHVSGADHVLGLRRFSLQSPHTRFYHWEALFFQRLRDEGFLAPRYEFVHLTVNGEDVGVMALEEHFSKELLEAQGRREGVMLRFDEDDFFRGRKRNYEIARRAQTAPGQHEYNWRVAESRPFREPEIAKSPRLLIQAELAKRLLRGLQLDTLTPAEVFDPETMGRFLAIHELFGFWHGLRWHNIRFYLNPITLKLEPIGFDATSHSGRSVGTIFLSRALFFAGKLASDPEIYAAYRRALVELLRRDSVEDLLAELRRSEAPLVEILRSDYPELEASLLPRMSLRTRELRKALTPKGGARGGNLPTREQIAKSRLTGHEKPAIQIDLPEVGAVYAFVSERPNGVQEVELVTSLRQDVVVSRLEIPSGGRLAGSANAAAILATAGLSLPLRLPANFWTEVPQSLKFALPRGHRISPADLKGVAVVPTGSRREIAFEGRANVMPLLSPPLARQAQLTEVLARHPFLRWTGEYFVVEAGNWSVETPLVIPKRLQLADGRSLERPGLRLMPGTALSFAAASYLQVWGSLDALGTASQPIELKGVAGDSWLGLVVFGSDTPSRLERVRIRDAATTQQGAWQLSSGMTFYRSKLTLKDVTIEGSLAEDALNLIQSDFRLQRLAIVNARSDGLDSDFSQGQLSDCRFEDIGGDALDLSGSRVTASGLRISRVADKAVSVGERSHFSSRGLRLESVAVGVVSKDASRVELSQTTARDIGYAALMSYRKKSEYGPGRLESEALDFDDSARIGIAQRGSELLIDGTPLEVSELDVDNLYRFGFMRKSK